MGKVYIIRDDKMNADVFTFMQQQDGAAGSYFYNWALMQQHRELSLHSLCEIDYLDDMYDVVSVNRAHICNMPVEDEK